MMVRCSGYVLLRSFVLLFFDPILPEACSWKSPYRAHVALSTQRLDRRFRCKWTRETRKTVPVYTATGANGEHVEEELTS